MGTNTLPGKKKPLGIKSQSTYWNPQFGITHRHWEQFQLHATTFGNAGRYVFLRTGKAASLKWIERAFPAKPISVKAKVDDEIGLLIAKPEDYESLFELGHFILLPADPRDPTSLVPTNPKRRGADMVEDRSWWRAGVVIDGQRFMPITSDYDLAVVIDADSERFDYFGSLGSWVSPGSRTTGMIEASRYALNRLFGSERIMHGPQFQYDQRLANKTPEKAPSEHIVAFSPREAPQLFDAPTDELAAAQQFFEIVCAVVPGFYERYRV